MTTAEAAIRESQPPGPGTEDSAPRLTLNPAQREAACAPEGPVLILGGSGTGRTHTVVARVKALLNDGINPNNITCLTLASRNAENIFTQVHRIDPEGAQTKGLFVGTFHHYATSFLKKAGAGILGIPRNYTIWDNDQATEALTQMVQNEDNSLKIGISELGEILRWHKMNLALWGERKIPAEHEHWPEIIKQYESEKKRQCVLDMDDLVPLAIEALESDPKTRSIWSNIRSRHILVDDFQDLSNSQYRMLCLMVNRNTQSITVCADPNQSIYGWRGGNPRLIQRFLLDFPTQRTYALRINHRNSETLVQAAQALTTHPSMIGLSNSHQRALRPPGPNPELIVCEGPPEKLYSYVADEAVKLRREKGLEWEDMALIYRRNVVSAPMSNQLLSRNIPYTVLGETRSAEYGETKRTMALLNLAVNPMDLSNFTAAASVESSESQRGLNPKTAKEIKDLAERENVNLVQAARLTLPGLKKGVRTRNNLEYIVRAWHAVSEMLEQDEISLETVCEQAGEISRKERQQRYTPGMVTPNTSRLLALSRMSVRMPGETLRQHTSRFLETLKTAHFVEHQGMDNEDPYQHRKGITLSTIHSAKGMQWKAVWFMDAADHVIPGNYISEDDDEAMGESQRIFYVATTRATNHLAYCYNTQGGRGHDVIATRFLEPLDDILRVTRI